MRALWSAILLGLLTPIFAAADAPLSLAQYIAVLDQLREAVLSTAGGPSTSSLVESLPAEWRVAADGREFTLSSDGLRQGLIDYAKQRTPTNRDAITAQLDLLLRNAHAMQSAKANFASDRRQLAEILSRREFRNVQGESWYNRWKRAAQRWFLQLLQKFLLSSGFPAVSRIAIWGLLALAIAVAGFWIIRTYRQTNIYTQFSGPPNIVSAEPWRDWQADAQAAAQEGRWHDAVRLLYWAGISFLEGQGLWCSDRARTPREYLRLLAAGDRHRDPLQQLTSSFEKVWYGNDVATAQTFVRASALLEQLGCR